MPIDPLGYPPGFAGGIVNPYVYNRLTACSVQRELPIAQTSENSPEYFSEDALGSVRQLVDANGNVTLGRMYKPYGAVLAAVPLHLTVV
jgi:hypothetical protein